MGDPGGAPGYERVAPTGLCVGFNGYCGPGGCTPGYKRAAPTGLCVGFNGYCGPGGCTPRLRNGRPYGAMRRVQLSVVRGYPSSLQGKRVIIWGNRVAVI